MSDRLKLIESTGRTMREAQRAHWNTALGGFKDDIANLDRAITYLQAHARSVSEKTSKKDQKADLLALPK